MPNKNYYLIFVYIGVIIWVIDLYLRGIYVSEQFYKPLPDIAGILFLFAAIFDRWIWKCRFINPLLVSVPNIHGVWQGKLVSSWIDKNTNEKIAPIDAKLIVNQTFTTIKIQLSTSQSCSDLINGKLIKTDNGYQLIGIYINTPKAQFLDQSPIHYGGVVLRINKKDDLILEGMYWTSRSTKGDMSFTRYSKKI